MKKIVLAIFIAFVLVACIKKRTIHISAINAVTKKPYPGLKYELVKEGNTGGFETNYKTVASGTLNENGEVYLTKHLSKGATYTIRVEEPPNCCYNKNISLHFGGESNFEAPFEFAECAYLTLSINNLNCIDSSDEIYFDVNPVYIDYNITLPLTKKGCYFNTFIESAVPYGKWKGKWNVTKGGVTTYHDSSFYINEGEHFLFKIDY